jgi:hypothetical protein
MQIADIFEELGVKGYDELKDAEKKVCLAWPETPSRVRHPLVFKGTGFDSCGGGWSLEILRRIECLRGLRRVGLLRGMTRYSAARPRDAGRVFLSAYFCAGRPICFAVFLRFGDGTHPPSSSPLPGRHFERSRPTFSSPFASCEWVDLRREKSLFGFVLVVSASFRVIGMPHFIEAAPPAFPAVDLGQTRRPGRVTLAWARRNEGGVAGRDVVG